MNTNKIVLASLISSLVLPVFSVQAEKIPRSEVPEAVVKKIKAEHPKAKLIEIDKEVHFDTVLYEVKYTINGVKFETLFTPEGGHFGEEIEIPLSELPQAIIKTLEKSFKQLTLEKAEIIKHPDGRMEYEVDVNGDGDEWEIEMTPEGKILLKELD
ncbi:MAG: PepSY-like domain-containing protein [Methylococcales bacterium]|nr:PepSY-like domain-containing protein [Methylococcales bacterium]